MDTSHISSATAKNWKRLGTSQTGKLTKRANKVKSKKRIIPFEYISNKDNIPVLEAIIDHIINNELDYANSIFSLCIEQLRAYGILYEVNVQQMLESYNYLESCDELKSFILPIDEYDFIGAIYQSLLFEGLKNRMGSYYTPPSITKQMTENLSLSSEQKFLDPCCGSGSFLLSLHCDDPNLLYGIDNDPIAVMIARTNLLCKYKGVVFTPHIYCLNYLEADSLLTSNPIEGLTFDYIFTNPPWGAATKNTESFSDIISGESFSLFFTHSFYRLSPNGLIRFLFPESILNVKTHKDIRKFIIEKCSLQRITYYKESFTGVVTSYVDILASNSEKQEQVHVSKDNTEYNISIETFKRTDNYVFNLLTDMDTSIIDKVTKISPYTLSESTWALGIVTGNNKEKLFDDPHAGMEPIYTGKEISKYVLKSVKKYIFYDRSQFQQVAKDEIYRASEKLVYKFISDKLVFAYDDNKNLFLNSANILIPVIPGMSVKTVMAFLNSELYSFLYQKLFGEIKILKGNLLELPFPDISPETNIEIEHMIDLIMQSQDYSIIAQLQRKIYDIFQLSESEIALVNSQVN